MTSFGHVGQNGGFSKWKSAFVPPEPVMPNSSVISIGSNLGRADSKPIPIATKARAIALFWPKWEVAVLLFCYQGLSAAGWAACRSKNASLIGVGVSVVAILDFGGMIAVMVFLVNHIRHGKSVKWRQKARPVTFASATNENSAQYLRIKVNEDGSSSFKVWVNRGEWTNVGHRWVERWGVLFAPFHYDAFIFRGVEMMRTSLLAVAIGLLSNKDQDVLQAAVLTGVIGLSFVLMILMRPFNWGQYNMAETISMALNTVLVVSLLVHTISSVPGATTTFYAVFLICVACVALLVHITMQSIAAVRRMALYWNQADQEKAAMNPTSLETDMYSQLSQPSLASQQAQPRMYNSHYSPNSVELEMSTVHNTNTGGSAASLGNSALRAKSASQASMGGRMDSPNSPKRRPSGNRGRHGSSSASELTSADETAMHSNAQIEETLSQRSMAIARAALDLTTAAVDHSRALEDDRALDDDDLHNLEGYDGEFLLGDEHKSTPLQTPPPTKDATEVEDHRDERKFWDFITFDGHEDGQ